MERFNLRLSGESAGNIISVILICLLTATFMVLLVIYSPQIFYYRRLEDYIIPPIIVPVLIYFCIKLTSLLIFGVGYLECRETGIWVNMIDTYGFINWDNLELIKYTNQNYFKGIGIQLKDVNKYIESRQNIKHNRLSKFDKFMKNLGYFFLSLCSYVIRLFSEKYRAKNININSVFRNDAKILEDNFKKFGFHILIKEPLVSDISKLLDTVKTLQPEKVHL